MNIENRIRVSQNIILSGGSCVIPGFKKRLLQEIKHLLKSRPEFEEMKNIEELLTI